MLISICIFYMIFILLFFLLIIYNSLLYFLSQGGGSVPRCTIQQYFQVVYDIYTVEYHIISYKYISVYEFSTQFSQYLDDGFVTRFSLALASTIPLPLVEEVFAQLRHLALYNLIQLSSINYQPLLVQFLSQIGNDFNKFITVFRRELIG